MRLAALPGDRPFCPFLPFSCLFALFRRVRRAPGKPKQGRKIRYTWKNLGRKFGASFCTAHGVRKCPKIFTRFFTRTCARFTSNFALGNVRHKAAHPCSLSLSIVLFLSLSLSLLFAGGSLHAQLIKGLGSGILGGCLTLWCNPELLVPVKARGSHGCGGRCNSITRTIVWRIGCPR